MRMAFQPADPFSNPSCGIFVPPPWRGRRRPRRVRLPGKQRPGAGTRGWGPSRLAFSGFGRSAILHSRRRGGLHGFAIGRK